MIASPLQLEWYFIKEIRVAWQPEFESDQEFSIEVSDVSAEVSSSQSSQDPLQWAFELSVSLSNKSGKQFPYTFSVCLVGFFQIDRAFWEKDAQNAAVLAKVNGPAVLYSAARENVATLTGRGPQAPLILPTVTFWQDPHATTVPGGDVKENKLLEEHSAATKKLSRARKPSKSSL